MNVLEGPKGVPTEDGARGQAHDHRSDEPVVDRRLPRRRRHVEFGHDPVVWVVIDGVVGLVEDEQADVTPQGHISVS